MTNWKRSLTKNSAYYEDYIEQQKRAKSLVRRHYPIEVRKVL